MNSSRLRNIWLSQKNHFHYFGTSIVISLALLTTCWMIALLYLRQEVATPELLFEYLALSLAAVGFGGLLIILHGVMAAHRVSETLERLETALRAVGEGDLNQRLLLNDQGNFSSLESAFNQMMEMMESRQRIAGEV